MASYGWNPPKTTKPKATGARKAARQIANSAKPYSYWAMDPKTRPKVPDNILKRVNPQAYQQRTQNRYMASPITEGSSVTNRDLDRDTKATVGLGYGYLDNELQKRYAQSDAMMQQIPQWFDYYRGQLQQLGLADAAAAQYATDQITNLGGTMAAAASKAASQDQAAMAQDAAVRGATVDPQAAVRAQQAAAVNTSDLATMAGLQTQLGYNSGQYFRGQEGVSEQAKVQQRLAEIAYRRNEIDPDAAQLAREKGDAATTYQAKRISDERQAVLENAAFGLKADQADQAAQDAAARRAAQDKKARQDFIQQMGITPKRWLNMTPDQRLAWQRKLAKAKNPPQPRKPETPSTIAKPPSNYTGSEADWNGMSQPARDRWVKQHPTKTTTGTSKPDQFGNTRKQRRAANDSLTRAVTMARTTKSKDVAQIRDFLIFKNVNPVMATAAAQMVARGYVDAKTARQLRRRGATSGYTTTRPQQPAPAKPKTSGPLNPWTIEPPNIGG